MSIFESLIVNLIFLLFPFLIYEIYIIYSNNEKFTYVVTSNYEVEPNDLSPIFNYENNKKVLTLVTCNNFNNNRIIIVAVRQ